MSPAFAVRCARRGSNAELKAMADKMAAQQKREIEQLKKFAK